MEAQTTTPIFIYNGPVVAEVPPSATANMGPIPRMPQLEAARPTRSEIFRMFIYGHQCLSNIMMYQQNWFSHSSIRTPDDVDEFAPNRAFDLPPDTVIMYRGTEYYPTAWTFCQGHIVPFEFCQIELVPNLREELQGYNALWMDLNRIAPDNLPYGHLFAFRYIDACDLAADEGTGAYTPHDGPLLDEFKRQRDRLLDRISHAHGPPSPPMRGRMTRFIDRVRRR